MWNSNVLVVVNIINIINPISQTCNQFGSFGTGLEAVNGDWKSLTKFQSLQKLYFGVIKKDAGLVFHFHDLNLLK